MAPTCPGENYRDDKAPAAEPAPRYPISKAGKAKLLTGENFWVVLDQPCLCPEADGHEEGMPWGVPASSWGSSPISGCLPSWGGSLGCSVLCGVLGFASPSPFSISIAITPCTLLSWTPPAPLAILEPPLRLLQPHAPRHSPSSRWEK